MADDDDGEDQDDDGEDKVLIMMMTMMTMMTVMAMMVMMTMMTMMAMMTMMTMMTFFFCKIVSYWKASYFRVDNFQNETNAIFSVNGVNIYTTLFTPKYLRKCP